MSVTPTPVLAARPADLRDPVRLFHGVGVEREAWDALDEPGRRRLVVRARLAALHRPAVVSHRFAGALWGLPELGRWDRRLHVTEHAGVPDDPSADVRLQQDEFVTGAGRFRVDFWWPSAGIIGEFDGRVKYDHPSTLWSEKRREDALRRLPEVRGFARWGIREALDPGLLAPVLLAAGLPLGRGWAG
ncbi:hypothetical protein QUG98_13460 [Curtobacterium sp. RHCJP20]|uniref:Uncharacterized protein n=1 Tax=Curtobacterium subtropicum TaxID=3055138 RepID=A0ABT7TIQ4_9MICO|nr:hypothetical protein [Curtobacterium subtropicum]MDM7889461.1 hypothetical protein [Curtobacterium subtropicum]